MKEHRLRELDKWTREGDFKRVTDILAMDTTFSRRELRKPTDEAGNKLESGLTCLGSLAMPYHLAIASSKTLNVYMVHEDGEIIHGAFVQGKLIVPEDSRGPYQKITKEIAENHGVGFGTETRFETDFYLPFLGSRRESVLLSPNEGRFASETSYDLDKLGDSIDAVISAQDELKRKTFLSC